MNGLSINVLSELWFWNDKFDMISVCNLSGMVGHKSDMGLAWAWDVI